MTDRPELFRELCEHANDLIQCVSPEGGFVYVNAAWLRTLGYRRKEIPSLGFLDIIHPDSHDHCRKIMDDLMAGRDAVQVDADFITKDGKRVAVEGSVRCWRSEGSVISTQGIFRDVTRRKFAQEELDRLFALSQDLLCIAGTDGFFKEINPAFERVLGYSREELLSRGFLEFVHEDDREGTLAEVENLARGQGVVDFENRYRTRNGDYRWLAWRSTPLPDRGLIYAVARDITELKCNQETMHRQAEELARSNADLEQFASVASHDLRAPLRSVRMLARWIGEELPGETPQEVRRNLDRLQDRVVRLDALIGDLMRYSRAGREPGEIASVDLAVLVDELRGLLAPPEGFVIRTGATVPSFPTDRAALTQILRNLIGNALKHHDRGTGEIVVSAEVAGEQLLISVSDDGPGIAPEHREEAFEAFRRLQRGKGVEGSGLGLALVKRLVEAHDGRIWLETAADRGLRVCFTWPRRLEPTVGGRTQDADDPDR